MKNFNLSVAAVLAMSTFAIAGGDIEPVVEPVVEEVVAPASDDSGFYIGGAYSQVSSDTDYDYDFYDDGDEYWETGSVEGDTAGYMLLAGYQYNKYISIEGRYWSSKTESSGTYTGEDGGRPFDGDWSNDDGEFSAWGVYLKPMFPVGESFTLYGLIGYGNATIKDEWYGENMLDEDGFQWGLGASVALSDRVSLFADYVQLASDAEGEYYDEWEPNGYQEEDWKTSVYTINVGVTYKF